MVELYWSIIHDSTTPINQTLEEDVAKSISSFCTGIGIKVEGTEWSIKRAMTDELYEVINVRELSRW